jgi:hypothetical protein
MKHLAERAEKDALSSRAELLRVEVQVENLKKTDLVQVADVC